MIVVWCEPNHLCNLFLQYFHLETDLVVWKFFSLDYTLVQPKSVKFLTQNVHEYYQQTECYKRQENRLATPKPRGTLFEWGAFWVSSHSCAMFMMSECL